MVNNSKSSLAKNSVVGAMLGVIKVCVQLVALPITAALLGPKEFAVYSLALPAVSLFLVLADAGIGGTLAREDEKNEIIWSSAFWAVISLCMILQLLVVLVGYVIAKLSNEPDLKYLMILLSFSLPLMGLTTVPTARLYRRGYVQFLAIVDALSAIVGVGLGILSARAGFG